MHGTAEPSDEYAGACARTRIDKVLSEYPRADSSDWEVSQFALWSDFIPWRATDQAIPSS